MHIKMNNTEIEVSTGTELLMWPALYLNVRSNWMHPKKRKCFVFRRQIKKGGEKESIP